MLRYSSGQKRRVRLQKKFPVASSNNHGQEHGPLSERRVGLRQEGGAGGMNEARWLYDRGWGELKFEMPSSTNKSCSRLGADGGPDVEVGQGSLNNRGAPLLEQHCQRCPCSRRPAHRRRDLWLGKTTEGAITFSAIREPGWRSRLSGGDSKFSLSDQMHRPKSHDCVVMMWFEPQSP